MKWIAVAIVIFIAGYTYVNLHYRKPGRAHEPYEDTKNRVVKARLETAGYTTIAINFERPADPASSLNSIAKPHAKFRESPAGLPAEIATAQIDKPILPQSYTRLIAPENTSGLLPISLQFTCIAANNNVQVAALHAYRKDAELILVPQLTALDTQLLSRTSEFPIYVTFAPGSLPAGNYQVTLAGAAQSCVFTLQVH